MSRLPVFLLPLAVLLPGSNPVAQAEPFFDPDGGPLTGLFGWPVSTEGGRLVPDGRTDRQVHVTLASHSVMETTGDQSLVLDGETTRLWLDWRHGVSDRLEVGVLLPWVWHESGSLDSLIGNWHDLFGLPQGNRPGQPEDRLLFRYRRGGSDLARLDRNTNGPGDLRIHAGWALRADGGSRLAVRVGLKLATGDSDELLGSGGTDFSIGLAGDVDAPWNVASLSGFWRISAIRLGETDLLPAYSRSLAGQLSAGFEYRFTQGFALGMQSTLRSAPFDVAVDPLGEWAMSLSAGARFRLPGDWRLSLGFNEDVKVESVPDITFLLTLSAPL